MGLTEEQTAKARDDKKLQKRLKRIILKYKPEKIFTHSPNDPHPIHKVTASQLLNAYDSMNFKCEVYSFDVWNPFNTHKHKKPRLVVDISDTFKIKLKALKIFKTQWVTMVSLLWSVYFKAFINGLKNDVRFAEVFYRIR